MDHKKELELIIKALQEQQKVIDHLTKAMIQMIAITNIAPSMARVIEDITKKKEEKVKPSKKKQKQSK